MVTTHVGGCFLLDVKSRYPAKRFGTRQGELQAIGRPSYDFYIERQLWIGYDTGPKVMMT